MTKQSTAQSTAQEQGGVFIELATLKWWRELVDLNPQDLAPRLDARINGATLEHPPKRAPVATHRHLKTGHIVTELYRGFAQVSKYPINEMSPVVIYEHNDKYWVRNAIEFDDGRFEKITDTGVLRADIAKLLKRLSEPPTYFSDQMMAHRTEGDADLIDQMRFDLRDAIKALSAAYEKISLQEIAMDNLCQSLNEARGA